MRVWDFPPKYLCDEHLLAQHSEIHAIYSIIVNNKHGFSHHPEVIRWRGKLHWLYWRHFATSKEMSSRGMTTLSPIPLWLWQVDALMKGDTIEPNPWQSIPDQLLALKAKSETIPGCTCYKRLKEAGY